MLRFSKSATERLQDFRSFIENGCIFICVCCNRRCFDTNIVEYNEQFIASIEDYPDLLKRCVQSISESNSVQGKQYICHTCKNYLKRGKMPPMSTKNGLDIVDLKDSNGNKIEVSELEATLIAKNILFMKIFIFPNQDGQLWKIKQSMFQFKMMLCCKQSVIFQGCPLRQESSLWN